MDACKKTIGTHSGRFHCDEVFAVFLLTQLPEYSDAKIVRTHDPVILEGCDIVVDAGGVYDPERLRFDHHQSGFNVTWSNFFKVKRWRVKLSSAGLIYVHFGKRVLSSLTGWSETREGFEQLFSKLYERFILEIDGLDNGIAISDVSRKYNVNTGISNRIDQVNPNWNRVKVPGDVDVAFRKAVDMVGSEFLVHVKFYTESWWAVREIVASAMKERKSVDESRAIIVLEHCCPWKQHVLDLERDEKKNVVHYPLSPRFESSRPIPNYPPELKFVVLPDQNATWTVQAVPSGRFTCRLPLPSNWRGLSDEELCSVSGIADCIFVHNSGHMGSNQTREGAIEMARCTLRQQETSCSSEMNAPPTSRGRGRVASRRRGMRRPRL